MSRPISVAADLTCLWISAAIFWVPESILLCVLERRTSSPRQSLASLVAAFSPSTCALWFSYLLHASGDPIPSILSIPHLDLAFEFGRWFALLVIVLGAWPAKGRDQWDPPPVLLFEQIWSQQSRTSTSLATATMASISACCRHSGTRQLVQ